MGFIKRVRNGIGAYGYAQLVTIGTQILGLPIYLNYWNIEVYGLWLMFTTIPTYLSLFDFGVIAVAGNKMIMHIANNNNQRSDVVFHTAFWMALTLSFILISILILGLFSLDNYFTVIDENRYVLLLLIITSFFTIMGSFVDYLYRSNGNYAKGTILVTNGRLFEWLFSLVMVAFGGGLFHAALGYLLGRLVIVCFNVFITIRDNKNYSWNFKKFDVDEAKELLAPSIKFMAYPIANIASLQGITIIVGIMYGTSMVVIYNSYRTLSRILLQIALLINKPLWPEFSKLYAVNNFIKIKKLYLLSLLISSFIMCIGSIFLYLYFDEILYHWTSNQVPVLNSFFILILFVSFLSGITQVNTAVLGSTNNHSEFFSFYLLATILGILGVILVSNFFPLESVVIVQSIVEICVLGWGFRMLNKKINQGVQNHDH